MHQARNAMGCSASRIKGELHPAKNRLRGRLAHLVRTFLYIDDSFELMFLFSGVAISRDRNRDTMQPPRRSLTVCTLRDIIPLARS